MKTILAFLLAPLVTLLLALLSPPLLGFFAAVTLFYAYPAMVLVGIPSYLYFRRRGWLKLWQVAGAGVIVGFAIPTLIVLTFGLDTLRNQMRSNPNPHTHLAVALALPLLGVTIGAAVSVTFWLIAVAPRSRAIRASTPPNKSLERTPGE
jgi:hypothetical protein